MTTHNMKGGAELLAFLEKVQIHQVEGKLETQVAKRFWEKVSANTQVNLDNLLNIVGKLNLRSIDDFEGFTEILNFAQEALEWAKDSEISYIEALAELPVLLSKSLSAAGYILDRRSTGGMSVERFLQPILSVADLAPHRSNWAGGMATFFQVPDTTDSPGTFLHKPSNPGARRGLLFLCAYS
ncbi:hypothetical protein IHN63_18915 [Deinococcus sp. 6YEL10]|uniref:hypothetical protein n=1 Tax=Deinococcus sp. 6YEL10 TaxID=2745870 RepID=UPI001E2E1A89|nr:hypothetical protein [Deinococcus sp. 6YEL10]MCD0163366.1 hypothetical protein [Deinococcus sp. 6YEL10]